VRKTFGATVALGGVELSVLPGEVHAIIGENGAGKSTLMKVLSGAHRPDAGEIHMDGRRLDFANPRQSQAAGIAMIYQELNLAPELTVCENISLGHEPRPTGSPVAAIARSVGWVDRSAERHLATAAFEKLQCTEIPLDRPAGDLSIAAQQMVEIARAIVMSQRDQASALKLLILDEPTSSLTRVDTQRLFAVIERLAGEGVSVLYISHFLEECQQIADRFTVLRDGHSVATGRMPNVDEVEPETPMNEIVHAMVGRDISNLYPHFTHTLGDVVLDVQQLTSEGGPQGVNIQLHRGEILGVAGLIGAGRTETLRAIFGLDQAGAGTIAIRGQTRMPRRPDLSWSRDSMGLVSEDRKNEGLFLARSLTDNLTITRMKSYRRRGLLAVNSMRDDTRRLMKSLDVKAASPDQSIGELSGGNQQKIAMARLLNHGCEILLLDEPTRGIDIGSKSVIYEQIGRLAAEGKSVLLVSSYLPELLGVCDTIGVCSQGRLVDVRPKSQWTEHELLTAAISTGE